MTNADAGKAAAHIESSTAKGERRQITALFYDLVNSTAMLNRSDPEDFGHLQRLFHQQAALAIAEHGGHLDQVYGDGGCAYFGYPTPTEDAAVSALAAALDVVGRCRSIVDPNPTGRPLSLRIGVATSLVVVRRAQDDALSTGGGIVGIAPTLASRIQSEAEPNGVLVADATYQLTRLAFEFEPLGQRQLKGFDAPQMLWRVVAKRVVEDRFSALRRSEAPLVAREDELELCRRWWARARAGRGQVVFLSGEAGMGKSRLVTELRQEAAGPDCDVRVFQCQPRGNTQPLYPFLDRLRRDMREHGASVDNVEAIHAYLRLSAPAASAGTAEMIAYLLGVSGAVGSASPLADLSTDDFRLRAVAAGVEIVSAWARNRPQLIVIEDVHWADTLTERFLLALCNAAERLRMLLLVTTRGRMPAELADDGNALSLSLAKLDERAVPQLVSALWRPEAPPAGLDAFVQEKSDGVPLFIEELTLFLRSRLGTAAAGPADWERVLGEDGVVTLKDLLAAQLADLGEARRVAQIASVIGREFPRDLLARVGEAEGIKGDRLDGLLGKLAGTNVIRRRGAQGSTTFRFHHVLMQEAIYDNLLKSERRHLHGRIVDAAQDPALSLVPDELLWWHCEQAGRPQDAAALAIRAAEACAARSAMREADQLLAAAERNLAACSPGSGVTDLTLHQLMTKGAVATSLHGTGSREASAAYEAGVALCRKEGGASRERFFALYWGWWFTAPTFGTQRVRSKILLEDLESASDPELRLQSLHCAWATHFHTGQHAECIQCVHQGLALYDPARALQSRVRYGGHDAKSCALGERGLALWFLGDDEAATGSVGAALRWAEETGHLGTLTHALDYAVTLARYRNDFGGIAALAPRLSEIGESQAMPGLTAKAMIFGGWARALTTSLTDGLREFEEGMRLQREVGTEENRSIFLDMHSELLAAAGDVEAGIGVLDKAIETFERVGQLFWAPELYRRRALLRQALGEGRDACLDDLQRSLSLSESQSAATLAARARADVERLGPGPTVHAGS